MKRVGIIFISLAMIFGLPLLGVLLAGKPLGRYLEFPPRTSYVEHEPFSWSVFLTLTLLISLFVGPILVRILVLSPQKRFTADVSRFTLSLLPWWGWLGIGWTGLWWAVAWTRVPWLMTLQEHTFTPLWLGYIVTVNACTFARIGRCMMFNRPRYFLSLFPLSAAFWWLFEYLNRFVQNWHYIGVGDLSSLEYVVQATIPFSTVLPAVLGTAELLTSYPAISAGLDRLKPIPVQYQRSVSWVLLLTSCLSLLGVGLWPNYLFPLIWVGPLLLVVSLQIVTGSTSILSPLEQGDWRGVWVAALSALICGFFWELWNWKSLAHWEYAVPFVHRFQLFEMPLLGYAGYLPFGLECLTVANFCLTRQFAGGVEYYRLRS